MVSEEAGFVSKAFGPVHHGKSFNESGKKMNDLPGAAEVYLRYITDYDDKALETLLRTYREGLYLFLLSYVKSEEDAEDLLMDTFARLAVDKPPFDMSKGGSFKSWLYAIARNNALMHIRRKKVQTIALEEEIISDDDTPESALLKEERNRKLYAALSALKPEYRRALMLVYIEGLKAHEIAQAMGVNIKQVYNLIERGKKTLRKKLEEIGITDVE